MHIIRKIIRPFGLDLHRYQPRPDKLAWLKTLNIHTVIDVGANVGQFANKIREQLPAAFIYSFEPIKECFLKLKDREKKDQKFKAFNFALGDINEKTTINKSVYTPSSSLLPMSDIHKTAFPHTKNSVPEKIEIRKMDEMFKDIIMEKEIIIKMDTQGYEDKVIAGGQKTFSLAAVLIVETSFVPLYDYQPLFANIYAILIKMGFTYRGSLHQKINQQTGQILFEDSIFVKTAN